MIFPYISHIDDLYPKVKDSGITIRDGVNYKFLQYDILQETNFLEYPLLTECRGIKFDNEGNVIARPFHKFFNMGQKECQNINLTDTHVIENKFDGSMIHTCIIDNEVRLMTKRGITDLSISVEQFLKGTKTWNEIVHMTMLYRDFTHIFEWCSPTNKIVLPYKDSNLVYLDSRNIYDGEYRHLYFGEMMDVAFHIFKSMSHTLKSDAEGVVLKFKDGNRVKVKTEWYIKRHKILSSLSERNVLISFFSGMLDDIKPLLDDVTVNNIDFYLEELNSYFKESHKEIVNNHNKHDNRVFFKDNKHKEFDGWLVDHFFNKEIPSLSLLVNNFKTLIIDRNMKPITLRKRGYRLPIPKWRRI